MSRAQGIERQGHFKRVRMFVEDDCDLEYLSVLSSLKLWKKIPQLVKEDRRRTIHNAVHIAGVAYGSIQGILASELNMRRVPGKFVPCLLEEKE